MGGLARATGHVLVAFCHWSVAHIFYNEKMCPEQWPKSQAMYAIYGVVSYVLFPA